MLPAEGDEITVSVHGPLWPAPPSSSILVSRSRAATRLSSGDARMSQAPLWLWASKLRVLDPPACWALLASMRKRLCIFAVQIEGNCSLFTPSTPPPTCTVGLIGLFFILLPILHLWGHVISFTSLNSSSSSQMEKALRPGSGCICVFFFSSPAH